METGDALLLLVSKILGGMPSQIFTGKVSSLNEDGTIDVERDEGDIVSSVKLAAVTEGENDFIVTPKKDSFVVCGLEDNDMTEAVVLLYTQIASVQLNTDELIFNKGKLGGLVLVNKLKSELKKERARIDTIINAINAGIPSAGSPDSGAALISSIKTVLSGIGQAADYSNIENEKITQ